MKINYPYCLKLSMNCENKVKEPQLVIWEKSGERFEKNDWTFNGASTRQLTHCYHDYPARMIPQISDKLLKLFGYNAKTLFDPYCGTGTSLVEGMIKGLNVYGTDLNPLARLIAQAKTTLPDLEQLDKQINRINKFALIEKKKPAEHKTTISGINDLNFWFKKDVIEKLYQIREQIQSITEESIRIFFDVVFSETVRECSNTRNDEFKLYRYNPSQLENYNPNVFASITQKIQRNRIGLQNFYDIIRSLKSAPISQIFDFNTVVAIPKSIIPDNSIDIVITSPPYGDSHTTVAYGQYSRLSAAWLGLSEPEKVDRNLMGGKVIKKQITFPCEELNFAINQINSIDEKRSMEVSSFYQDLFLSISNVGKVIKPFGYACYVIGNRKVKGIELPTDRAVRDFFTHYGFDYVDTFTRSIPNKRMPLKNSPTNEPGINENTMTKEYVVVMRKKYH